MRLAKFISYITHPVLITTYMLAYTLFQKNSYLYYTITANGRWFFLLIALVLTVIAPLISVGYLVYSKQVSSFYLDQRKERIIPMSIAAAYTLGLYYMFMKFTLPPIVLAVVGVGVIGVAITLIITLFWKISAHMMGIAGFGGVVFALSKLLQPVPTAIMVSFFLLAGFVGYARIKQDSHTLNQVLAGWFLGFIVSYEAMIFLVNGSLW